jgi:hypothetical protein
MPAHGFYRSGELNIAGAGRHPALLIEWVKFFSMYIACAPIKDTG